MKFISSVNPSLKAGQYIMKMEQVVTVKNTNRTYFDQKEILVSCPRFSILDSDVYEVYPPANSVGHYLSNLPYIQFTKQTLPWLIGEGKEIDVPWMAVFVFQEDDDIRVYEGTLQDYLSYDKHDIAMQNTCLHLEAGETATMPCRYIEIATELFKKIAPTTKELSYLAHCKEMPFVDKVTNEEIPKQAISCLISNQYITDNSQYVCVVSIEGMKTFLDDHALFTTQKYVRLPLLKDWHFYKSEEERHFKEIFEGLNMDSFGIHSLDNPLFDMGYVVLEHQDRIQNRLASFYHGPFVSATGMAKPTNVGEDIDEYLLFDPELAMFDVSYSAAFQLGILLAYKNKECIALLSKQRLQLQSQQRLWQQREILKSHRNKEEIEEIQDLMRELGGQKDV